MKNFLSFYLLCCIFFNNDVSAQPYLNCFNTQFNENATGRNDVNAYLLSYLSSAVYADVITQFDEPNASIKDLENAGTVLQKNETLFLQKFKKVMAPLFFANYSNQQLVNTNIKFFNVSATNFDGYDPEAIVINADNAIFISWRGTDRVQNKTGLGYEIREWWHTDFQAIPFSPGTPYSGKVHQGAWLSINKIAVEVANAVQQFGGNAKKVWITGHSLGGGQAQLFAGYLFKSKNIKAQGVYTYAAPQMSSLAFNTDLENNLGGANKIQRFEFSDDPISCAAQIIPEFKPAGIRNHYANLTDFNYNAQERSTGEIARIAGSLPFALFGKLPGKVSTGGFCFHYQHWYVKAAHNQLSATQKNLLPPSLNYTKVVNEFCSNVDIARAENGQSPLSNLVGGIADAGLEIVDNAADAAVSIVHQLGNLLENFTANPLDETYTGYYKIKNAYSNKYLCVRNQCRGENECKLLQWSDVGQNGTFKIEKYSVGGLNFGYSIKLKNTSTVIDVPGFTNDNVQLQMYNKNIVPTPNQAWAFYQVPDRPNHFIIQAKSSGKVIDMSNSYSENGTPVKQRTYSANRVPQVWILEKVN